VYHSNKYIIHSNLLPENESNDNMNISNPHGNNGINASSGSFQRKKKMSEIKVGNEDIPPMIMSPGLGGEEIKGVIKGKKNEMMYAIYFLLFFFLIDMVFSGQ
jgi:hypothetical protein